jgi:hypothetical protein
MKTLYVNGDSHTANVYPAGVTAAQHLAQHFNCSVINDALAGGSNQRIIRTTLERLPSLDPTDTVILIGWSSFERTEWYYSGQWHQICGDQWYQIIPDLQQVWQQHLLAWHVNSHYENFRLMQEQHSAIWRFHNTLVQLGYHFCFYQGCDTFFFDGCPQQDQDFKLPWNSRTWIHDPYVQITADNSRLVENFSRWALSQGFSHSDDRAHFGQDAHTAWAKYLQPYLEDIC